MAIDNAIRLLSFGLLVALSASASSAQQTPAPMDSANQGASPTSTVSPPAILAEMPPKAPRVTCNGDQLTISADNSTLGSVLAAVHVCIGVQIDIPAGAAPSRTFGQLGPGPERQVLESLLSGTDFNYVIGSSDSNPQKVETVLLLLRTTDTPSAAAIAADRTLTPARRAWMASRQNRAASLSVDENRPTEDEVPAAPATDDAVTAPAENAGTNATPVPAADTPPSAAEAPPTSSVGTVPTAPTADTPSGVSPISDQGKGTAERINDMQQLFQQRRQMTQSQTSATPQQ